MQDIQMNGAQRGLLRKAISCHAGWNELRAAAGYDLATAGKAGLLGIAAQLSIDVAATIAAANVNDGDQCPACKAGQLSLRQGKFGSFLGCNTYPTCDFTVHVSGGGGKRQKRQPITISQPVEPAMPAAVVTLTQETVPVSEPVKPAINGHDPSAQLAALIGQIAGQAMRPEQISALVKAEIAKAFEAIPAVRIEVRQGEEVIGKVDGHQHPQFKTLLKVAASRMPDGFAPSVWIAGPAGSGKTYGVHMVAKALNTQWHFNGALGMSHELTGFVDAGGTYHTTPFRNAYETGGVYLFDEVDGSDNSALLALNAALANGRASFPDKQIERHPDCRIFAAANTWGLGATAEYVGRAKIDSAFLDRFPVRIFWDYDVALEVAMSGNPDWARRIQGARERARHAGLKINITPRATLGGAALIANGFTSDEAASLTYLANLTTDQRRTVEG